MSGDDPKKKPKDNEYYAGDGQGLLSGGTGGRADDEDVVKDIFNRARANGAVPPDQFVSHQGSTFTGTGRRLGYNSGPSPAVQRMTREEVTVKLSFYKNGFRVNDGPLRAMTDPANKTFLDTINKGFVPQEIADAHPGADVNISLEDRAEETYVEPFRAFAGGGQSLRGAAAAPPPQPAVAVPATFEFNEAEPAATLMLQLLDGTRLPVKVNPQRHTVADLRAVVRGLLPAGAPAYAFVARDGPRPRPLSNESLTIEAAGCARCVILLTAL